MVNFGKMLTEMVVEIFEEKYVLSQNIQQIVNPKFWKVVCFCDFNEKETKWEIIN